MGFKVGQKVVADGREGTIVNADVYGDGTTVEVEMPAGTRIGRDSELRTERAAKLLFVVDEVSAV